MRLFTSGSIHQGHEAFTNETRPGPPVCLHGVELDFVRANFPGDLMVFEDGRHHFDRCRRHVLGQRFADNLSLMQLHFRRVICPPEYAWSQSTGPV